MPSPRKLRKTASAEVGQQSIFDPTISTSVCNGWVKAHYILGSVSSPGNTALAWWTEAMRCMQDQETLFFLCFGPRAILLHILISSWMGRYNIFTVLYKFWFAWLRIRRSVKLMTQSSPTTFRIVSCKQLTDCLIFHPLGTRPL